MVIVIAVTTETMGGRTIVAVTTVIGAATMTVAVTMTGETEIVAMTMTEGETATGTGVVAVVVAAVATAAEVAIINGKAAAEVGVEIKANVAVTKVAVVL